MSLRDAWSVFAPAVIGGWVSAAPVGALERCPSAPPGFPPGWDSGESLVTILYYNTCTGWTHDIRVQRYERYGVVFEVPTPAGSHLLGTWFYATGAAPYGYGYSNVTAVWAADSSGCPIAPPLATNSFVPWWQEWYFAPWGGLEVPERFVVTVQKGPNPLPHTGLTLFRDHPAAGPTGPPACGTCYPTTRETHSFFFGTGDPLCPGAPLFDGTCNAEILCEAVFVTSPVGIEEPAVTPSSWGSVKALYR